METVLVVDDQLAVRTALSMLFDVHGIRCEAAGTPEAAVVRRCARAASPSSSRT